MRSAIHSTTTVFWIAGGTTEHWPRASTWLGGPAHGRVVPGLITPLLVDLYSAEPRCLRADWISFTYTDITMSHDYTGIFSPGWNWMWGREAFFFIYYIRILRMRLWIFCPGWNFLSITWGISARSTGLKISSRVAQTVLMFQPRRMGWFLHVIADSVLQRFM